MNTDNKSLIDMNKWNNGNSLEKLIKSLRCDDIVLLEIGSYRGQSAEHFLNTGKIKTLYCVDPWKQFYDANDIASTTDMKLVEQDFDNRIMKHFTNVVKHVGTIDTFVKTIHDKIDVVYIDGLHTYEGCNHDIAMCKQFIKPRLAYAGHDYSPYWSGVKQAVDEHFNKPDMIFLNCSWLKFVK